MARLRIGELLVSAKVITEEQLQKALQVPRAEGQRLGEVLVAQGLVSEAQLTQTLGQQLSVPWVSLYHVDFSRQLLNLVPQETASRYCLVPIFVRRVKKQDTLYVAMADPTNEAALEEVARSAALPVKPMIAAPNDIRSAIRVYYGVTLAEPAKELAKPPPPPPRAGAKPPPPPPSRDSGKGVAAAAVPDPVPEAPPSSSTVSAAESPSGDSPDADPEITAHEIEIPRRRMPMVSLTLLDGSTIQLPARTARKKGDSVPPPGADLSEGLTARDLIRALRAVTEGADARAVLGEDVRWEPLFAALLSLLLRKGVIADWEFIDEFRKLTLGGATKG